MGNVTLRGSPCVIAKPNMTGGAFLLCETDEQPGGNVHADDLMNFSPGDTGTNRLINTVDLPITSHISLAQPATCGVVLRPEGDKHQRYVCQGEDGATYRVAVSRIHFAGEDATLQKLNRNPDAVRVLLGILENPTLEIDVSSTYIANGTVSGTFKTDEGQAGFVLKSGRHPPITWNWPDGRETTVRDMFAVAKFRSKALGLGSL